jgi:hypothetical protein
VLHCPFRFLVDKQKVGEKIQMLSLHADAELPSTPSSARASLELADAVLGTIATGAATETTLLVRFVWRLQERCSRTATPRTNKIATAPLAAPTTMIPARLSLSLDELCIWGSLDGMDGGMDGDHKGVKGAD